ncbi:TetR/AcrR family transcriptional regulator [Dethiothermospora halolimnae]|uniref:TetR/AcrR family transcriptional regulator n=1 Tax=Dethiothermospora halolimnae TaxID=3114390 RepID=UPI003CCC0770
MPKIIKNLEHKIFEVAFKLFGQYGYKGVDMKKIAKEVGIAVGTLYNYYPNKKQLFLSVFKKSWEDTFLQLEETIKEQCGSKEKIVKFITILYDEVESRKGLGEELFREKAVEDEKRDYIRQKLISKLKILIEELIESKNIKLEKYMVTRLVETILVTTIGMLDAHPQEREKNIEYITYLLKRVNIE